MDRPIKVLVTSNSYPPDFIGGAELVAHRHAQLVRECGIDVEVFAGDRSGARPLFSVEADEFEGLLVHRVAIGPEQCDQRRLSFLNKGVDEAFALVAGRFQPDIVHLHNTVGLSLGMIHEAKRRGAATIVTVHDHWGFCLRNTLLKWDQELCFDYTRCEECLPYVVDEAGRRIPVSCRRDYMAHRFDEVDLLISPSRYLGARYAAAGFPPERISQIDYGVDLLRFGQLRRTPSSTVRFSFVGYLGEHKGLLLLLDALEKIPSKLDWRLNLVGAGHLEAFVQSWCDSHRLADRVKFWGRVDAKEVEAVYTETDALILPSIWPENQPVTILEAMTNGLPVIASRLGGNPEIVEDGISGWTFDPEDPDDLARCMIECVRQPGLRLERGAAGLRRAMTFPYRHQAEKLAKVYRDVVGRDKDEALIRESVVAVAGDIEGNELGAMAQAARQALPGVRVMPIEWLERDEHAGVVALIVVADANSDIRTLLRIWQEAPLILVNNGCIVADSLTRDAGAIVCASVDEVAEALMAIASVSL